MLRRERTLRSIKELSKKYGSGRTLPTSAIRRVDNDLLQEYKYHSYGYRIQDWNGENPLTAGGPTAYCTADIPNECKLATMSYWGVKEFYNFCFGVWLNGYESLGYYDGAYHYKHSYRTYFYFRRYIRTSFTGQDFLGSTFGGNLKNGTAHSWDIPKSKYSNYLSARVQAEFNPTNIIYIYHNGQFEEINYQVDIKDYYYSEEEKILTDSLPQHRLTAELCEIETALSQSQVGSTDLPHLYGSYAVAELSGTEQNSILNAIQNNTIDQALNYGLSHNVNGNFLYNHDIAMWALEVKPVSLSIHSPTGELRPPALCGLLLTDYR